MSTMGFSSKGKNKAAKSRAKSSRNGKAARNEARRESYASIAEQRAATNPIVSPMPNAGKRKTREEVLAEGRIPIPEEWTRIYCLVAYEKRFNEPSEEEWGSIAATIHSEIGCSVNTVKKVFKEGRDGEVGKAVKRKAGSGRKRKLDPNNKGLLAAAMALNVGVPPTLASY